MNGNGEPQPASRPGIQVLIELDPVTHNVQLRTNTDNGVLFLGILEQAKLIFLEAQRRVADKRIALAPPGLNVKLPRT